MKKNGFLIVLSGAAIGLQAHSAVIKTFEAPDKTRAPAETRSAPAEKVEFKVAQGQNIAQNNAAQETYIVRGRIVAQEEATLNKEKFSAAGVEEITDENFPQIIESFDYPNADIVEVTKAISELTGKNFIIDPNVRGKINIIAPTKITVAEAYKAFLSALAINAFAVVPQGSFLKIRPTRNAQRDNIETYTGEYYPDFDQMITRIIHLKHISADEVSKNLRILPSKDGELTPYPQTNSLILTDFGGNVNRVMKIIEKLDRPGFEEKMEVIRIIHATAKEMAGLIEQIITKGEGRASQQRGSFSSSISRFNKTQTGGSSEVISLAVPDDRTNSIIVVGNDAGIQRIRRLVARLDFKLSPEDAGGVQVYYVKHGEAEKIEQTLSGLATAAAKQQQEQQRGGGGATRPGGAPPPPAEQVAPIFGGEVKIVADKATNSLIISANKADYATVMSLLAKIDIPRDQVYVEAVIMEMNATDGNTWGASYFAFNKESNGAGRIGFNSGNIGGLTNPLTEGAILAFGSGETVDLNIGGQTVKVPSLVSFIQLLKTHTQANILSTPQILALSNEKSTIEVGDEVPVALEQGTTTTGTTTANVKREKATIKLEVTPFISPDSDSVRMKILQTARAVSEQNVRASQLADVSVILVDRSIDTNIVVRSGDTAVLGGLMRTEYNETVKKVPILGDIPILGWLFKSSSKSKVKSNLLVFLTPKILRNASDTGTILRSKMDERIEYIQENFGGRDPFGKQMDELMSKSQPAPESENDIVDETLTLE